MTNRFYLIFLGAIVFGGSSSFALNYEKYSLISESRNRPDWWSFTAQIVPESEEVADILNNLDFSKNYDCEIKAYKTSDGRKFSIAHVFAIKNCVPKLVFN